MKFIFLCLKLVAKCIMQFMAFVACWICLIAFLQWNSHFQTRSQKWEGRAIVIDGECFVHSTLTRTQEVIQWCRDNGATELTVVK